jgi:hypothetical protein
LFKSLIFGLLSNFRNFDLQILELFLSQSGFILFELVQVSFETHDQSLDSINARSNSVDLVSDLRVHIPTHGDKIIAHLLNIILHAMHFIFNSFNRVLERHMLSLNISNRVIDSFDLLTECGVEDISQRLVLLVDEVFNGCNES